MKKIISLLMSLVLCIMPMSAMAEVGSSASLEAILEIEPENMTYDQYFMFEHGFHSDEGSANATLLSRKTKDGDSLLTQNAGAVYADGRRVSGYVGNSEMVFYMVGNSIYRYHVKSQRTDLIYQGNGIVTWYPITSKALLIGEYSGVLGLKRIPVCTDQLYLDELEYYKVDTDTNQKYTDIDPERLIYLTESAGYTHLTSYSRTINGKAIPMNQFPINSVYTGDGQCAGFARDVYQYLWGDPEYGTNSYPTGSTVEDMCNELRYRDLGARVRVSEVQGSQNPGHSFIITSRSAHYITAYHANWENDNVVRVTLFSYEQLYSLKPYVYFVKNP